MCTTSLVTICDEPLRLRRISKREKLTPKRCENTTKPVSIRKVYAPVCSLAGLAEHRESCWRLPLTRISITTLSAAYCGANPTWTSFAFKMQDCQARTIPRCWNGQPNMDV